MRELDQVSAGAYAAMFEDHRIDTLANQLPEQRYRVGVYTRIALHQTVQPGNHHRTDKLGREQVSAAGAVTANEIVLKLEQVPIPNFILGHRTETGIDAIDQLVRREFGQELKVLRDIIQRRS